MLVDRIPASATLLRLSALAGLTLLTASPCLAAGPAPSAAVPPPGTWRLIPLPNQKVPAAWVINTATGETYLCGSGANNGHALVACVQADFAGNPAR